MKSRRIRPIRHMSFIDFSRFIISYDDAWSDSAKKKIDMYIQDNVKLFIQNKNSNRVVYTR